MTWRLGLDLGTNSIGWAALELNAKGAVTRLLDMGVCIFPDGREPQQQGRVGDSLAVTRRLARSMRRNRDRGKNRKARLMGALVVAGLMPGEAAARKALEALNPYELRARAVGEPLSAPELGRALFHLGLRRGFKSNRKTDGGEESGKQAERIAHLREALSGHTLGQYLWAKLGRGEPLRFREGAELFPERAMYEVEFDAIRAQQKPHHPATPAQWEEIRECVFFQHPLRPVERGRCEFFPDQDRAHKDLPIAQTFRILQELNNLRWIDAERREHPLDPEQRDHILAKLHAQQSYKFTAMRKAKGTGGAPLFPDAIAFNLEDERRKDLSGHKTDIDMAKPQYLGDLWATMPEKAQNDLFELLHEAEDDADTRLRAAVTAFAAAPENRDQKLPQVLADFAKAEHAAALEAWAAKGKDPATAPRPIRRLRLLVTNQTVAPVASAPYKGYAPDAYVFCDIWRVPAGRAGRYKKGEHKWIGAFRSVAEVAHPPADANAWKPHPAARRVMRLFKDDMVEMTEDGQHKVMRVAGFSTTDNRIDLCPHLDATSARRYISINVLKDRGLRKLHVTPDGRIAPCGRRDP